MSFNCPLSFIEALNNFEGGQDRYAVAAQSGNTLLELTLLDHQRYQGPPPQKRNRLTFAPPARASS